MTLSWNCAVNVGLAPGVTLSDRFLILDEVVIPVDYLRTRWLCVHQIQHSTTIKSRKIGHLKPGFQDMKTVHHVPNFTDLTPTINQIDDTPRPTFEDVRLPPEDTCETY